MNVLKFLPIIPAFLFAVVLVFLRRRASQTESAIVPTEPDLAEQPSVTPSRSQRRAPKS